MSILFTLLVVASVAALVFLRRDTALSGMVGLNPFGPSEDARRFFSDNPHAARVGGFFGFASAILLAIYLATIADLKKAGARFRNVMEVGPGGKQIQLEDPDGNPVELFEPAEGQ